MKKLYHIKIGDFAPAQSTRTLTPEGFLLCKGAKLAKAPQVRTYYPEEFGGVDGLKNGEAFGIYTAEDELFKDETIRSFEGVDSTNNHPPGNQVNAATWSEYSIGLASNVQRVEDYLVADLLIKDSKSIQQIQTNEKIELSLGYMAEMVIQSGVSPDGTPYHAEFRNIVGNHVALVHYGRCGGSCRIGDENPNLEKTMKIIVDGIPFDVADNEALAAALQKQQDQLQNLKAAKLKIGDQEFSLATELEAVQAVADKLVQDHKALADKVPQLEANQATPEKLEALAADRASVIQDAKKLNPNVKTDGCSCEQIKREAVLAKAGDALVVAVLGSVAIGDANPEQLDTAFRALVATSGTTNPANHIFTPSTVQTGDGKPDDNKAPSKADAYKTL
ncbi:DUF2213 domain-containing protein [Acinetobacter towneri]|uniref:DUF2213 domain-containing protein n=1 Tax=Acinetobacter towneri TaxID=202956 RepID=A0AAP9GVJ0_9GAMM|nr:DUF2213 domain-containing protein [Acinetobacter towneri]QGM27379.1 DUF2213 domain-containing protein [Acinetobacter towneri]